MPEVQVAVALRHGRMWLSLWLHYGINMQQILNTKVELHLMHQCVHREHSLDKIDRHLHEGEVAARHAITSLSIGLIGNRIPA